MTPAERDLLISRGVLGIAALGLVLAAALRRPVWVAFFAVVGLAVKFGYWSRHRPT